MYAVRSESRMPSFCTDGNVTSETRINSRALESSSNAASCLSTSAGLPARRASTDCARANEDNARIRTKARKGIGKSYSVREGVVPKKKPRAHDPRGFQPCSGELFSEQSFGTGRTYSGTERGKRVP